MKRIAALVLFAATAAFAQAPQRPSDEELNARIQTLSAQRNVALDQVVVLSGQATAEIGKLQAEIERLKKEAAACTKPAEKK